MEELDNANSIHGFSGFEEEGFVKYFQCHFRLVDIPRDAFHAQDVKLIKTYYCSCDLWKYFFVIYSGI